jgi:hypothetical protein
MAIEGEEKPSEAMSRCSVLCVAFLLLWFGEDLSCSEFLMIQCQRRSENFFMITSYTKKAEEG